MEMLQLTAFHICVDGYKMSDKVKMNRHLSTMLMVRQTQALRNDWWKKGPAAFLPLDLWATADSVDLSDMVVVGSVFVAVVVVALLGLVFVVVGFVLPVFRVVVVARLELLAVDEPVAALELVVVVVLVVVEVVVVFWVLFVVVVVGVLVVVVVFVIVVVVLVPVDFVALVVVEVVLIVVVDSGRYLLLLTTTRCCCGLRCGGWRGLTALIAAQLLSVKLEVPV